MIIITRHDVTDEELDHIRERVEAFGLETHLSRGAHRTVVGCIGDEALLAGVPLMSIPGVEAVHSVMKPYKLANLQFAAEPTKVPMGSITVGDTPVAVIAGPCSVEGLDMLTQTAERVKAAGAVGLRGGAFKPRSSPYSFGGLGEEGLKMLADVRAETGLPIVTEIMDPRQADLVAGPRRTDSTPHPAKSTRHVVVVSGQYRESWDCKVRSPLRRESPVALAGGKTG